MRSIHVRPQDRPLQGTVTVPGDKSISHRAIMLGAIADGVSMIRNWLPAGDTLATLACMQALGVTVEIDRRSATAWDLQVTGVGLHGLKPPAGALDCRNAGTAIRLLSGIMSGQAFPATLDGSDQLRKRPMGRIVGPLTAMGASISASDGRAPLHFQPASLSGIDYHLPVASAQVKSAVLLAGLYASGATRVFQPGPSRDHTERMLAAMGVDVTWDDEWVVLQPPVPGRALAPLDMTVPGDMSSAAFLLVAAATIPHSQVTIKNVGVNVTRTGLPEIMRQMGASIVERDERIVSGEPVADLSVSFDELHATEIDGATVVRAIDELPIWAVLASQAAGDSTVSGAAELRVKEVDRIGVLAEQLRALGLTVDEQPDGFTMQGPARPTGGVVDSHDDHRLAMALTVAGLLSTGETTVLDAACVSDSFPGFVETMQAMGANVVWTGE